MTALEAVRGELATLRPRVKVLEQAETLLAPAYVTIDSTSAVRPDTSRRAPARKASRAPKHNLTRVRVRDHILEHGPLTRRELVTAFGGNSKAIDNKLRLLLLDGEIAADGRPGTRRYRSPDDPDVASPHAIDTANRLAPSAAPEHGVYPVYDAIVDLASATTQQLAERTRLPSHLVVEQGRRLIQLGFVRFTGTGSARMWLPAQPKQSSDAV
jgi:hypothetical protein